MSGAKIADVEVSAAALGAYAISGFLAEGMLSAAERLEARAEQRRVLAAQDAEQEGQLRQILERRARLEALHESQQRAQDVYGVEAELDLPTSLEYTGHAGVSLADWLADTDAQLSKAEKALQKLLASTATTVMLSHEDRELVTDVASAQSAPRESAREQLAADLTRILSRLDAEASAASRASVLQAADRVATAPTSSEAETLLTDLRIRVREANKQTQSAREQRIMEEQKRLSREYVSSTITDALSSMGYEVSEGLSTLTASHGEATVTRDAWPDHAVKLRLEEQADGGTQMRVAMLRTRQARSQNEKRRDAEREDEWCDAFEQLREILRSTGVNTDVTFKIEHMPLPVTHTRDEALQEDDQYKERER